jgi:hypothetical protein
MVYREFRLFMLSVMVRFSRPGVTNQHGRKQEYSWWCHAQSGMAFSDVGCDIAPGT